MGGLGNGAWGVKKKVVCMVLFPFWGILFSVWLGGNFSYEEGSFAFPTLDHSYEHVLFISEVGVIFCFVKKGIFLVNDLLGQGVFQFKGVGGFSERFKRF